ncbi:hypothetical protein ONZ45_g3290 [Pleurotus djamor]|nr:hypothetical protein ONZ45_g3290 [Pleurotus djamor]
MACLPPLLPEFPQLVHRNSIHPQPWSDNVTQSQNILFEGYRRGLGVLQEEADLIRLRWHRDKVMNDLLPLLFAIEDNKQEADIADEWLVAAATALAGLILHLDHASSTTRREENHVIVPEPLQRIHTGNPGRPSTQINATFLADAMKADRNISKSKLAAMLGISRPTLNKQLRARGLHRQFNDITNDDLDLLVKTYRQTKPQNGIRYLTGFLRRHGLRIQRHRVNGSINRVDPVGRVLRRREAINRRDYKTTRPNAVWHCDGHHKLIRWGIVIHGFVDGYCRTVVGLRASTSNSAETVLDVFLSAVEKYGDPSRVRGDRGGENILVSIWMILRRGPNRASFMWGTSTHNTRIERLWVEVGRHFGRQWRAFFSRLERLHHLDREDPHHLWLLHVMFLHEINNDADNFIAEWNAHPISGKDTTHNMSPNDMRLLGQVQNGVYNNNDYSDAHPAVLQVISQRDQNTAGPSSQLADNEGHDDRNIIGAHVVSDMGSQIGESQANHIRHDAIPVPSTTSPFPPPVEKDFLEALPELAGCPLPRGFGLHQDEWEDGQYPTYEHLSTGHRRKELRIALSSEIWQRRAERWVVALNFMLRVKFSLETPAP